MFFIIKAYWIISKNRFRRCHREELVLKLIKSVKMLGFFQAILLLKDQILTK
jgi:hypothetical protein